MNQQPHQADTSVAAHAVPTHAELPVIVAAAQPVPAQAAAYKAPTAAKPVTAAKPPTAAAAIQMEQEAASNQARQAADKLLRKKRLGEFESEQGAESSADSAYEVAAADTSTSTTPPPAEATGGTTAAASGGGLPWLPVAGVGLGLAAAAGGGGAAAVTAAAAGSSSFAVSIAAVAGPVTAALNYKIYDAAGNVVASGVTDATGKITVNLGNAYAGQALLISISDANGAAADYRDEATNGATSLGGTSLRAAFVATGSDQSITVSPITELAVEKMGITTNAATASAATVTATNASVGTALGVTDILGAVTTVLSADYVEANGINAAEAYGQALAKLSGLDAANGSVSATLAQLLAALNIVDPAVRASTLVTLLNEGAARFETGPNAGSAALVLAPTLAIADSVASGPTNAPVTYTFTFSEAVTGFDAADVTVTNGTKGVFTAVSTTVYTLVVTPTANATGADIGVSVNSGPNGIGYQTVLTTSIVKSAAAQAFDTIAPTATIVTAGFSADTGSSATDFNTATAAQTISGTLSANLVAGEIVQVSTDNGATWATATTTVGANTWSLAATLTGSNTLQVRVTDTAGNSGPVHSQVYVLDTVAPTSTVATAAFSADTGSSATDFNTATAAQSISGTLSANMVAGEIVQVSTDNGATWSTATTTVGANTWALAATLTGSNTLQVRVADTAGNAGAVFSQAYVLDTVVPTATVVTAGFSADTGSSATDFNTSTAAQTISGTLSANMVAGEIVQVSTDNGATWSTATTTVGANTWSLAATLTGSNTLQVRVADTAGNAGAVFSQAYVLDTVVPTATVVTAGFSADTGSSATDFNTSTAAQTISGTLSANMVAGEIVQVSTDNGATWATATTTVGANTWSLAATLTGSNTLQVRVADTAGNVGAVFSQAYVLDTVAPTVIAATAGFSADTGSSASDFNTATAAQTISGTLSANMVAGEVVQVSTDNGVTWNAATTTVGSNTWSLAATLTGSNTLQVRVSDTAGNSSTVFSQAYVLDTVAPVVNQVSFSANENGTVVANLAATDVNAVTWGSLSGIDAALFSLNAAGVLAFAGAKNFEAPDDAGANRVYDLSVQATDTAGNVTTQAITVNLTDVNEAPTVANAIADQTFLVGGAVDSFTFAANTFADPDTGAPNNTLTYTATLVGGGALPAWLSFDAGTRTFSGNPPVDGATTVRVTATDGGTGNLSVFDDFVINAISAPAITSAFESTAVGNFDVRSNIVLTASESVDLTGITAGTKFIHIVNTGGTGYYGESTVHTFDIDVTDSSQVTIVGNKITLNPTYDLDLSNNYHITVDAGAFHGVTSGQASIAVSSVTAMDFSTVAPGTTDNISAAVMSQKMDATGALANSYQYLDVEGIGNNTGSMTALGSLSGGQYALVIKNYEDLRGGDVGTGGNGTDGVAANDTNIGVTNFGMDDVLYIDSQFNSATARYALDYSLMGDGATVGGVAGQNLVYFGMASGQSGSAAHYVLGFEGNAANTIYSDLPSVKTALGWTADPVIQG